jgi:hypothetical protein
VNSANDDIHIIFYWNCGHWNHLMVIVLRFQFYHKKFDYIHDVFMKLSIQKLWSTFDLILVTSLLQISSVVVIPWAFPWFLVLILLYRYSSTTIVQSVFKLVWSCC